MFWEGLVSTEEPAESARGQAGTVQPSGPQGLGFKLEASGFGWFSKSGSLFRPPSRVRQPYNKRTLKGTLLERTTQFGVYFGVQGLSFRLKASLPGS